MSKKNCSEKSKSSKKKCKKCCCCCKNNKNNNNYNNMMTAYSAYNAGFNAGANYANFGSCGLGTGFGCGGCGRASYGDPIFPGLGFGGLGFGGLGFGAFNPLFPLLFL
ncbi:MAG: hypothetical protein ACI398_00730 [Clostridium sp.]